MVAVATIGPIHEGRVEVRDAAVLRGDAPASFEIKRSPANPPPFVTGVPAVLLLRGARPPYVLVDEPRELILPTDAATAKRWTDALRSLFAAEGDPDRLLHTYLLWLDGDDETLREAAAAALADPRAPYLPLDAEDATARARAALDPRRATDGAPHLGDARDHQRRGRRRRSSPAFPATRATRRSIATALRGVDEPAARERARPRCCARSPPTTATCAAPRSWSRSPVWTDPVAAKVAELAERDADPSVRQDAQDVHSRAGSN